MKLTMLETRRAALDGVAIVELEQGQTYELPAELAARYLDRGLAREPKKGETVHQPKSEEPEDGNAGDGEPAEPASGDPLEGLNAKQAAKAISELTVEELDRIPADEDRKAVLAAVAARREELAAGDDGDDAGE